MAGTEIGAGAVAHELDNETSWPEAPQTGAADSPVQSLQPASAEGELEEDVTEVLTALGPEFEVEPAGRNSLAREEALAVAIEESLRALLTEVVDFELAFQQLQQLAKRLAAGEVRLRTVVDVSGNFESSSAEAEGDEEEPGTPDRADTAVKRTVRAFEALARLRESYLRLASKPRTTAPARVQLEARRRELIRSIEQLSIHPTQLRLIDSQLEARLSSSAQAEQALLGQLRAAGRRQKTLPPNVRAWRLAIRPLLVPGDPERARQARQQLAVLRQLERDAGLPLSGVRTQIRSIHRAQLAFENAKSQMVRANMVMVRAIAAKYSHHGLDPTDLLQEGSIGLMRAVERFDHRRGFRFSTYAQWWIRQAITRAIADQGRTIRVPVHMNEQLMRLRRLSSYLSQRLGRPATIEEVAEAAALSPEKAAAILRYHQRTLSLDAPVNEDSEASLLDLVADPNTPDPSISADQAELGRRLEDALCHLPPKEQQVLRLRFGIGAAYLASLEEIGNVLGVTRERIRQIELKALKRLQRRGRGLQLDTFLTG